MTLVDVVDLPIPVAIAPAVAVIDGDLRDPVDGREAGDGVGFRDRVKDDPVAMGAEADKRRAGSNRHARCRATPHDGAAPLNRRLVGMHLCPHGRVQSVRADQQGAVELQALAVASPDQRGDAAPGLMVAIAGDLHARADGVDAETFYRRLVQEHLQAAPVNGGTAATCNLREGHGVPSRRHCRSTRRAPTPWSARRSSRGSRVRSRAHRAPARRWAAG